MKYVRRYKIIFFFAALILFLLSGFAISYDIHRINQKFEQRMEDALKLAEITLPQAVWFLNEEYMNNFINALFLENRIVYVEVHVLAVQKIFVKRTRPSFKQNPFSFYKESSHFITGTRNIFYEGQKAGIIGIAVSRKGIYKELISNTLSAIGLMCSVMIIIGFYYIRLKQSERKFKELYDNAIEAVFQTSPEGHIIDANPSMVKILQFGSLHEMISAVANIREIYVNPEHREELIRLIQKNSSVSGFETRFYRKDGKIIWVSIYARAVRDKNGKILRYEGMFTDITGAKEKEKAERKREIAEATNKKIMSSINYAKLIQRSLLANLDTVKSYLPNSFFIWEPRDIVGGDIFYTDAFEEGFIVAVIDCTGHGVPGAFMTMIVSTALKRITKDEGYHDPAKILKRLNYIVKTTLHQDTEYAVSDDGLDIGICFVSQESEVRSQGSGVRSQESEANNQQPTANSQQPTANNQQPTANSQQPKSHFSLTFAGARIPLYYAKDGEIAVIKGDRQSIGYKRSKLDFDFTNHQIPLEKGMNFYMTTDGFTDQLGGENGFGFGRTRLKKLLNEISGAPFEKQRTRMIQAFEEYRGEQERQDDMTVVGFGF